MFAYFIPISLLVLAGFTLGLLVGWLVWGSKSTGDREPGKPDGRQQPDEAQEPQEPEEPDDTPEAAATDRSPETAESTPDPPVWQVREVPAFDESGPGTYPNGHLPQKSTRSIGR